MKVISGLGFLINYLGKIIHLATKLSSRMEVVTTIQILIKTKVESVQLGIIYREGNLHIK